MDTLRMVKRYWVAPLGAGCLLVLGGCTAMKLRAGLAVELAKTPVSAMEASLPNGAIAPGEKSPLVVKFTAPNGTVLFTQGKGGGKVMWKDLKVAASIVQVDEKGNTTLTKDPRVSDGKKGHVTVTAPSHPDMRAELDIPFRYDIKYVEDWSGRRGANGLSGSDGLNGTNGSDGSTDPNHPTPGSDGTNGSAGSDGHDGDHGGDASNVDVLVALDPGNFPLLQVSVAALGRESLFLVDPRGGSLLVKADGGPGGFGGRAGKGGRGGRGGTGTPSGHDGLNGLDGRKGFDGPPGEGGRVTVTYEPQARQFISAIHVSAKNGPPTVFREDQVAPLW